MSIAVPEQTALRPLRSLRSLTALTPTDVGRIIRLTLMSIYCAGLVIFTKLEGMIWRRLDVAAALGLFLVCAYVGRTWRTWASVLGDVVFYCAMWWTYETTRGVADEGFLGVRFPLQVESLRNVDRFLFFGADPNVVLQDRFWQSTPQWWDVVASTTYMTHFVIPPIAMGALWATSRYQWWRFMKRFASVLVVACAMFIVLPAAPPWMAADRGVIDPLVRQTGRGFSKLGLHAFASDWQISTKWGNAVAAMPSLHSSFALIVPAFFLPWIQPRWLKLAVLVFPILMLISLVYLGEHWVIDGIAGFALVGASFWFWNWQEGRARDRRTLRAHRALADLPAR